MTGSLWILLVFSLSSWSPASSWRCCTIEVDDEGNPVIEVAVRDRCQERCVLLCADVLSLRVQDFDTELCEKECGIGCSMWQRAVGSSCIDACNDTSSQDQFLIRGCEIGVEIYAEDVNDTLKSMDNPGLLDFGNYNLTLQWKEDSQMTGPDLQTHLQVKRSTWTDYWDVLWDKETVQVLNLSPFMVYKFRMMVVINEKHKLPSSETNPYQTIPDGVPMDSPEILAAVTTDTSVQLTWKPPKNAHDRLVMYRVLLIQKDNFEVLVLKQYKLVDMYPNADGVVTETVTRLKPGTTYDVKIAAKTHVGFGPNTTIAITTQAKTLTSPDLKPYLLFGADHKLMKETLSDIKEEHQPSLEIHGDNTNDIMDETVLNTMDLVEGVAVHYNQSKAYFSDSSGKVYRVKLDELLTVEPEVIYSSSESPQALSVDWMNNHLYISENNTIVQCSLEGKNCTTTMPGLDFRANNLYADPCSGFLYWVIKGPSLGIYRADLHHLGVAADDLEKYKVVDYDDLAAFTLDQLEAKLYFPDETTGMFLSSDLDGSNIVSIRPNTTVQTNSLHNVTSLAYHDGHFYWSTGDKMFDEDIDMDNIIYHNQMMIFGGHFVGLNVVHLSQQPTPVASRPPTNLQVLFSSNRASLSWDLPANGGVGGIWKEWSYEIQMNQSNTVPQLVRNATSRWIMEDLLPKTIYSFRVRAYSEGGIGPWTAKCVGETLADHTVGLHLLFANRSHLYHTDLDGSNIQYILSHNLGTLKDLMYTGDEYIVSTQKRRVYSLRPDDLPRRMPRLDGASALAYERVAKVLYWAKRGNNMIFRTRLATETTELIQLCEMPVQDMTIDSREGIIYFTTARTVEAAHLDGSNAVVIDAMQYFSGYYILGVTLDFDHNKVYWMVKNVGEGKMQLWENDILTKDHGLAKKKTLVPKINSVPTMVGLTYFSERLMWLSDQSLFVIPLNKSHNVSAFMLPPDVHVDTFQMLNGGASRQLLVNGRKLTTEDVIPSAIDNNTIGLSPTGTWDNFTITWTPTPVQHGEVFYQVNFHYNGVKENKVVNEPQLTMTTFRPHTKVVLSIKSCTYWGCSNTSGKSFTTPMAAPSSPLEPKVFVTFIHSPLLANYSIKMELHWLAPRTLNGNITKYWVYTAPAATGLWSRENVSPKRLYKIWENARHDRKYFFKVEACTPVGCSDSTSIVKANTKKENPVSRLLIASESSISRFFPDIDESNALAHSQVVGMACVADKYEDETFYWLDKAKHVVKLEAMQSTVLASLNGTGKSLSVDWIGRVLYWVEEAVASDVIWYYDLNQPNSIAQPLTTRPKHHIGHLDISPYHKAAFWSETDDFGVGHIMKADLQGNNVMSAFRRASSGRRRHRRVSSHHRTHRRDACNCPLLSVTPVFAIDHSRRQDAEMYVVEASTGSIIAADSEACQCRTVVDAKGKDNLGLPPDSLAVDHLRVYWSNKQYQTLNSVEKLTGQALTRKSSDAQYIFTYGPHVQPLPAPSCLIPNGYQDTIRLQDNTSSSLELSLQPWQANAAACSSISLPAIKYTLHYRLYTGVPNDLARACDTSAVPCLTENTYSTTVNLTGLEVFKMYLIQVSMSNYYTETFLYPDSSSFVPVLGAPVTFRTREGTPSPARNVTALPSTPEKIEVLWQAPAKPNGPPESILYEVWATATGKGILPEWYNVGNGSFTAKNTLSSSGQSIYHTYIDSLNANTSYNVKVLTFDRYHASNASSDFVRVTTHCNPNPILVEDVGQRWINLKWQSPTTSIINSHKIEFAKIPDSGNIFWKSDTTAPVTTKKKKVPTATLR